MGIDAALIETIVDTIGEVRPDEALMGRLRERFPGVRLTACFDDDIHSGKPVYTSPAYAVYLVGSGEHCLSLTNDYEIATGVVIAEIMEE